MKKMLLFLLMVLVLTLSSTVSADERHHDWSHPYYQNNNWHQANYQSLPFRWHEHPSHFVTAHSKMKRIHNREWDRRFPGLHSYQWRTDGAGFWYRGERITTAVLFYNDDNELVSVGFKHDGAFIMIRDDHNSYENHSSFFLSWSN